MDNDALTRLQECKLNSEKRWSEVNVRIQKINDKLASHGEAIDKQAELIKDIQNLSTSVSVLANNMQAMLTEQQAQGARLSALEARPAKRWDAIVDKVIMLIVGGLVGYCLVQLGLQ